jgi:hypothetical protein
VHGSAPLDCSSIVGELMLVKYFQDAETPTSADFQISARTPFVSQKYVFPGRSPRDAVRDPPP